MNRLAEQSTFGRRRFLIGLGAYGVCSAALESCAAFPGNSPPRTMARVGLLAPAPVPPLRVAAFRSGLADLGWIEGRNVTILERYGDGTLERISQLTSGLIDDPVDVIVGPGGMAAVAAQHASATIPIVVTTAGDPIAEGYALSFAQPGRNVTGLTIIGPQLQTKRLELLTQVAPGRARVAVLLNLGDPAMPPVIADAQSGAQRLHLDLQLMDVRTVDDLANAAAKINAWPAQALAVMPDVFLLSQRASILDLAERNGLPGMYAAREWADAGGLISYGPSQVALYQRAAWFVDRILRGAKPADLPFEQPTQFELVVNRTTAAHLGLSIPSSIAALATELVQ